MLDRRHKIMSTKPIIDGQGSMCLRQDASIQDPVYGTKTWDLIPECDKTMSIGRLSMAASRAFRGAPGRTADTDRPRKASAQHAQLIEKHGPDLWRDRSA